MVLTKSLPTPPLACLSLLWPCHVCKGIKEMTLFRCNYFYIHETAILCALSPYMRQQSQSTSSVSFRSDIERFGSAITRSAMENMPDTPGVLLLCFLKNGCFATFKTVKKWSHTRPRAQRLDRPRTGNGFTSRQGFENAASSSSRERVRMRVSANMCVFDRVRSTRSVSKSD